MNEGAETALRVLAIGIGATAVMDIWALALKRFGVKSLNFAFLGRWVGHLPRRRFFHTAIAQATPVKNELLIGWLAHYLIGITFAGLLIWVAGLEWARSPTLMPAIVVGVATVIAPLFVLQPALGAGIASSKTATPVFNAVKSVVTHIVFGFGMYLTALLTSYCTIAGG